MPPLNNLLWNDEKLMNKDFPLPDKCGSEQNQMRKWMVSTGANTIMISTTNNNDYNKMNGIFIVGCGHSGTSLLLKMLGSHSLLNAVPVETQLFTKQQIPSKDEIRANVKEWEKFAKDKNKTNWIEKTPGHVCAMSYMLSIFPNAKFIVIVRDGRDVVASLMERSYSLEFACQRWLNDNSAALHFKSFSHVSNNNKNQDDDDDDDNDSRVYYLKYEEIVENAKSAISNLCKFLNIEFEIGMISEFQQTEFSNGKWYRLHSRRRQTQLSMPLYDARGRWKKQLTISQKIQMKKIIGNMIDILGYGVDNENRSTWD